MVRIHPWRQNSLLQFSAVISYGNVHTLYQHLFAGRCIIFYRDEYLWSMKKSAFLILLFLHTAMVYSQTKQTEHYNRVWGGYFNQTRFSNKWGTWTDIQLRTEDGWADGMSQFLARMGLTYYISDATKLTAGYAYILDFPAAGIKIFQLMSTGRGNKFNGTRNMAATKK